MMWFVDTRHCRLCLDADSIADDVDDASETYGSPMFCLCLQHRFSRRQGPHLNRRDISLHPDAPHVHLEAGMQQSLPVLPEEYEDLLPLGRGGTDEETGRQHAHDYQQQFWHLCPCTSWWWMYPHPSPSYVGESDDSLSSSSSTPRELVGIVWFLKWLVRVTLTCAWLWVIISAMVIGMVDSCYARGHGIVGWTVFAFMLMLLIPTCGRGPCKLIHGECPSALMVAAMIVIVFSAPTSRQKSHYECF